MTYSSFPFSLACGILFNGILGQHVGAPLPSDSSWYAGVMWSRSRSRRPCVLLPNRSRNAAPELIDMLALVALAIVRAPCGLGFAPRMHHNGGKIANLLESPRGANFCGF